jgi:hypothetical protein
MILKKIGLMMLPGMFLGLLAFFFPFFYAVLPVHEAEVCLC